jgi:hemerythrin-like metal-binding protein
MSYEVPHTGIEEVDGQLHVLLYHLLRFPPTGAERRLIKVALGRLDELWMEHCKSEEALMVKHAYLEREHHLAGHQRISLAINAAQDRFSKGQDVSLEMTVTLREWLIDHILILDMQLADWITRDSAAGFQDSASTLGPRLQTSD